MVSERQMATGVYAVVAMLLQQCRYACPKIEISL